MLKATQTDFYLISPPPGAAHKPVPASKLVFAGDSAGGALCVTALTVIRDMGLPMPAGAVLISPWVDMTHSFPSVMENTHSVRFISCPNYLCSSLILNCHSRTSFLLTVSFTNRPQPGPSIPCRTKMVVHALCQHRPTHLHLQVMPTN